MKEKNSVFLIDVCEVFEIPFLLEEDLVSHSSIAIAVKRIFGKRRFKIFII